MPKEQFRLSTEQVRQLNKLVEDHAYSRPLGVLIELHPTTEFEAPRVTAKLVRAGGWLAHEVELD